MQLRINSTSLVYSPGVFAWTINAVLPDNCTRAAEILAALGIPNEYITAILSGHFEHHIDGETLVIDVLSDEDRDAAADVANEQTRERRIHACDR